MATKLLRISNGLDGAEPNGASGAMDISSDGRFVAFVSEASNLVAGDRNGTGDVFLFDRKTGVTERVSVATDGSEANGYSGGLYEDPPAVSDDGRFVTFTSAASNLVAGDDNGVADIFRVDRTTGRVDRISETAGGGDANGASGHPTMSADGRFVVYLTEASNIVPGGAGGPGVVLYDAVTGNSRLVSADVAALGIDRIDIGAGAPAISADGRFVAFGFGAERIGAGPTVQDFGAPLPTSANVEVGCFLFDRVTGEIRFVGVETTYGIDGWNNPIATRPSLSSDGSRLAFVNGHADYGKSGGVMTFRDVSVVDTGTGRELARYPGSEVADVPHDIETTSLSANGRRLAYTLDESWYVQSSKAMAHEVGRTTTVLEAGGDGDLVATTLSGNGKVMAFAYDPQPFGRTDVYLSYDDATTASPPPPPRVPVEREGTDAADKLAGTKADDQLFGLAGADRLAGKQGNDLLDGGQGDDVLNGGGGADTFVVGRDRGADLIQDLRANDRLDLSDWFESASALPASWRDGVAAGDEGVTAKGKSLVLDLGQATGGPAGEHVVTLKGVANLGIDTLVFGAEVG